VTPRRALSSGGAEVAEALAEALAEGVGADEALRRGFRAAGFDDEADGS